MAIYKPGQRFRYHRILRRRGGKRSVTALLSLTAMVDMFTVLVVFLLQNFSGEQQMLQLHKDIELPKAKSIKELKPAFVVTISKDEVLIDEKVIGTLAEVQAQTEWMIPVLYEQMQARLAEAKLEYETKLQNRIRDVVQNARGDTDEEPNSWKKITIQADRKMDILTIKKVMFTVTEAGAGEINFAVMKENEQPTATN